METMSWRNRICVSPRKRLAATPRSRPTSRPLPEDRPPQAGDYPLAARAGRVEEDHSAELDADEVAKVQKDSSRQGKARETKHRQGIAKEQGIDIPRSSGPPWLLDRGCCLTSYPGHAPKTVLLFLSLATVKLSPCSLRTQYALKTPRTPPPSPHTLPQCLPARPRPDIHSRAFRRLETRRRFHPATPTTSALA